ANAEVVLLSTGIDERSMCEAIDAGVADVVDRQSAPGELEVALRRLLQRRRDREKNPEGPQVKSAGVGESGQLTYYRLATLPSQNHIHSFHAPSLAVAGRILSEKRPQLLIADLYQREDLIQITQFRSRFPLTRFMLLAATRDPALLLEALRSPDLDV